MELYSSLFLPLREFERPNNSSTLETFFIRETMETIIVSFETRTKLVLLEKFAVEREGPTFGPLCFRPHLFDCLVPWFVASPLGHSCCSFGPYSVVSKGLWQSMFQKSCCPGPGWRQSEE